MCDAVVAVYAATATPIVALDAGLEVVLVTPPALLDEVSELAQELLAAGFEASIVVHDGGDGVVSEICSIGSDGLIVLCHRGELDHAELRSRCEERGVVHHEWLDCATTDHARTLYGTITARIDAIADERSQPCGDIPDIDEVSNVVLMPLPPPKEPPAVAPVPTPPPTPRSPLRAGLASAALTAMSAAVFWAVGGRGLPADDAPTVPEPRAEVVPAIATEPEVEPAPESTPPQPVVAPAPEPVLKPVNEPVPSVPDPVPPPEPEPEPEPVSDELASLQAALDAGTIVESGDLLVTQALPGERTWFQAMTWCRSRAFGGVRGWKTPRRADLVVLAKARVLPDAVLWSRNRSDDTGQAAFTLHGRSGRLDRLDKYQTTEVAVCVLVREEQGK